MRTLWASCETGGSAPLAPGALHRIARAACLGLAIAAISLGGCKSEEKKAEDKAVAASNDKDTKARTAKPEDDGIEVPTEEDFEENVQKQITAESDLKKELDDLEKQIGE